LLELRAWRFAVVIFWFAIFPAFAFSLEVVRLATSAELVLSEVLSYGFGFHICGERSSRGICTKSALHAFAFQIRTEHQDWRAKIFKSYSVQRFWNNINSTSSIMPNHDMESDEQVTPTPSATDSIPRPALNPPQSFKSSPEPPLALKIKSERSAIPDDQVTPTPSTDSTAQLDLNRPRSSKSSYESDLLQIKSEASALVGGLPFGLAPQLQQVGVVLGLDSKPLKSYPSSNPARNLSLPGNAVSPDVAEKIKSSREVKVRDPCRQNIVWLLLTWNT
jgi:hypothetical protein